MDKKFEIERKYLVVSDEFKSMSESHVEISQGYLNRDPQRTVRVRRKGDRGFLTVKGLTTGIRREEYEYEIPITDALNMLELCLPSVVNKTRWHVPYAGHLWEVDEFHGNLQGLILAEVEIPSEDTGVELPPFIGEDVSNEPRYFNSNLSSLSNV